MNLEQSVEALGRIFRSAPDKRQAHERSIPVLTDMTGAPEIISDALRRHVEQGPGLTLGHYPVISLMLETNAWFDLVMNCWLPQPDGATDVSTKAIHHHGEMLLTTATAYGPGYEHWTFSTPEPLDPDRELFSLRVLEQGPHPRHHVAFVDRRVAHVPLYVPSLTITLALWSSSAATTWRDHLKRAPFVRGRAPQLRRLAAGVGLAGALDLKLVEYFDYYPTEGGFAGMRERQEFPLGPNADYVQSLLHVIQHTGNQTLLPVVEEVAARQAIKDRQAFSDLVRAVRADEPVLPRLSDGHYGVPFANFRRADIEAALARLRRG